MSREVSTGIPVGLGEGERERPGETDRTSSVMSHGWALSKRESRVTGVGHGAFH